MQMQLFLDTKTRLFYLFKILVTMTTISVPKNPQTATSKKRNIAVGWLLRTRTTFTKSVMVSVGVSKLGRTHLILVDPGIEINGAYYQYETGDAARYPCNLWRLLHFFSRTMHRPSPIGPVRRWDGHVTAARGYGFRCSQSVASQQPRP